MSGEATGLHPAGDWSALLDDFEALLDDLEARLDTDDWEAALPGFTAPPAPAGAATPAQQARYEALAGRAAACRSRLVAELGVTRDGLDDLRRRRGAAQRYGGL